MTTRRTIPPILTAVLLFTSSLLHAATIRVPEDHESIQEALDAAADGDEVILAAGEYGITSPLTFQGKDIHLKSAEGFENTTIRIGDLEDDSRGSVFVFENAESRAAIVEGLTITGGTGIPGFALFSNNVTLNLGGGFYFGAHSEPTIKSCRIQNNMAGTGGGAFVGVDSEPTFEGCYFIGNRALSANTACGGAIAAAGDSLLRVNDCVFEKNHSDYLGGGVCAGIGSVTVVENSKFIENTGTSGIGLYSSADFFVMKNCDFIRNVPQSQVGFTARGGGAAIRTNDPSQTATIENCRFEENQAYEGGGLFITPRNDGFRPVLVSDSFFRGNMAMVGGGLALDEDRALSRIVRSHFLNNHANFYGGGISVGYEATSEILSCVVENNTASMGGGVWTDEDSFTTITRSTIGHNAASTGGGVWADDDVTIDGCIIADNAGQNLVTYGLQITDSCIPGLVIGENHFIQEVEGLIDDDPLFAGWADRTQVYIDPSAEPGGDGTRENPWSTFVAASNGYRLSLTEGSPCIGTGPDGENMGAPLEVLEAQGVMERRVLLSGGLFEDPAFNGHAMSVFGSGSETTRLRGCLFGIGGDRVVHDLTVFDSLSGGITFDAGTPSAENCVIRDCWVFRDSALKIGPGSDALVENCKVLNCGGGWPGGAVTAIQATARIVNSVFAGNLGSGGVLHSTGSTVFLSNCQITGNSAHQHGALMNSNGSRVELNHCTIATNFAAQCSNGPGFSWINSIVRDTGAPRCAGDSTFSADPLFVRPGTFVFSRFRDIRFLGDFLQVPDFVDEAGDYRLTRGSTAIDEGVPSDVTIDFDGQMRPCGSANDFGAFEFCKDALFTRGDLTQTERIDISDPVSLLRYLFADGQTPIPCLAAADADDGGVVDLSDAVYLLNFLFLGGSDPMPPFRECGEDPTPDELGCEIFAPCEV